VPESVDGRRARGDRRRAELIDATLRVIERSGVAGVTHRAVATAAGVPPAAATYHFGGIDDLLLAALREANERYGRALRELADSGGGAAALAAFLAGVCREHRGRLVAEYELYLLAARRPALRLEAAQWTEILCGYLRGCSSDDTAVRAAAAAVDGLLAAALFAPEAPPAEHFHEVLDHILRR
jgi:DNA-binding transcriptional regulator YbjK